MRVTGRFDGSCWPNPGGQAKYGFVIYKGGHRIHDGAGVVGVGAGMTNNVAEAAGLCALLEYLITTYPANTQMLIQGDSQIVINVANGRQQKPHGFFAPMAIKARELFNRLQHQHGKDNVQLEWIPRDMNAAADAMCDRALELT